MGASAICSIFMVSATMWAQPLIPGGGIFKTSYSANANVGSIVTGPRDAAISTVISVTNGTPDIVTVSIHKGSNTKLFARLKVVKP